ncbi:MAG: ATP-binding protein [Methyloligella sp. ZOD6]
MADQRRDSDLRPQPDALLTKAAQSEKRAGRLKIFLGAAPGVGKTFAMLEEGRLRQSEGKDVIAGLVETHGRVETGALLDGLETIPRQQVAYKGRTLDEMDLDALLAREPELALVDELAHTNAHGSRHPKRCMDVDELLAAGIDVYTTLNIQHIESLNDVVAQITGVRVRETVPDAVLDRADAIELVDITPEDLIERLRLGKVYVPDQAKRALEHFFSPANLTALRELALRRTAERVDEQLLNEMQSRAISGPWAAGERLLLCISEDPHHTALVRYTKRLADRLHAPWTALYVESGRAAYLSEAERDRIADTLRLAEALGGETVTIPGSHRIADDVLSYARTNNVTQIIVGKSQRSAWFELWNGSVVRDLTSRSGNISLHVIAGEREGNEPLPQGAVQTASRRSTFDPKPFAFALAAVGMALLISIGLWPFIGLLNTDLVFLTAVVIVAVRFGLWPSMAASVIAALCYNFFFTEPYYTFSIADPRKVVAVLFFTAVALLVSNVAARARRLAIAALSRARTTESLYSFSKKLAGAGTLDDVLWASAYQIASMLRVRVVILLPEAGEIAVRAGYPPEDMLSDADLAAANWAWEHDRPAGRGSDTLPGAKRLFLPMRTGRGAIGAVGIDDDGRGPLFTTDQRRLLDALTDQAALAVERVFLVNDLDRTERQAEADRLRGALLNSISHDLKTPLASILGASGTLKDFGDALEPRAKAELLGTVVDESERLNRFIANLLDMTKLESGAIRPNADLYDIGEILGTTLERADKVLANHETRLEIAPDLPMLSLDPVLFEQVLFNLLDNAAKYAPELTAIEIRIWQDADTVRIRIQDEGPGVPVDDLQKIFDKFQRAPKGDQIRAGTGLGLAISRGFVEAMGGCIEATNRTDRSGAAFTISLPIPAPALMDDAV